MPRTERLSVERKPKSAFKTIARISQYMLHKKWMLALSVVFVLISAGAGVTGVERAVRLAAACWRPVGRQVWLFFTPCLCAPSPPSKPACLPR